MALQYRCRLIPALLLALFLLAPFSPALAMELSEDGFPLPKPNTDQVREAGRIDRIEGTEIVVNDRLLRLLPSTLYYNHFMRRSSPDIFREGQSVGYIVNKNREILILWLYKGGPGRP